MTTEPEIVTEARKHLDAGRQVVPCHAGEKRPVGNDWANHWQDGQKVLDHLTANPLCNLGLVLGKLIDIETDTPEQAAEFERLFDGDLPRTPSFASSRGKHYFFKANARLTTLGKAVLTYREIGIRVGSKAAQSVIPPSVVGSKRQWEISFDDCEAADLPESVVERILAECRPPKPIQQSDGPAQPSRALAAMLRIKKPDTGDGSKRLLAYCCRGVEHNLDDQAVVAAVRECAKQYPFPQHDWTDADIIKRIRDAEARVVRGSRAVTRPEFDVTERNLDRLTTQAWELIDKSNEPPVIFRFGGHPHRVELDDKDQPSPKQLTRDLLRHHLAAWAYWFRRTTESDIATPPPMDLVDNILATPDMRLPILERITQAPVFAPSGELQTEPGYHAASRTLYMPATGFQVPAVSPSPTPAEIQRARDLICLELLGDFPFVGDAERAHAVSLLLLPFARGLIGGNTPLHLFEKPSPGTGATLLVNMLGWPAIGDEVPTMTEAPHNEEWRKLLTAKLKKTPTFLFIDNLKNCLDSAAVASAITSPTWEDRLLGGSNVIAVPVRCAWIATGNNPKVSDEIARRTVRVRLNANVDRPELRTGFRHPNLPAWVKDNRADLVWAALTLIQAWIAAGKPPGGKTLGMFEDWSSIMGGILQVASIDGFLSNRNDFNEQSDTQSGLIRNFLAGWWDQFGAAEVKVKELHQIARDDDTIVGAGNEQSQKVRLGTVLSDLRERVYDIEIQPGEKVSLRIDRAGTKSGAAVWKLHRMDVPAVSL